MVNRLDGPFRREWFKHQTSLMERSEAPSFHDFLAWIEQQTNIARFERNSRLSQTTSSYAEVASTNNIAQKSQIQIKPKPTPGGDKEYRDSLRQKRNNSPKPQSPVRGRDMLIQNQTPQRTTLTPKSSPNNSFLREEPSFSCAWCHYNKKPHDHTTEECYFIKDADALDQWRAIYFNRVCNKCLSQGHIWKDCTLTSPPCNVCNLNHHVNLKCRPIERISRYPSSNAQ